MTQPGERLIQPGAYNEMVMGNTAVVRAMVETQTRVVSSYPGSPTPEIAAAIRTISEEKRPFYFEFSVNEKVASEVAFGAALNGNLSCVFFKSVGLNVAMDTFVQFGLMNIPGGLVVVIGDDPGANSSQNEQDNRHIFKMARLTVFEPASPREVYGYYKKAAQLARIEQTAAVLRLTTHVCHARQKVSFDAYEPGENIFNADFDKANGPYIPITNLAIDLKRKSFHKLTRAAEFIRQEGLNTLDQGDSEENIGIIVPGMPYLSLKDVLALDDGFSPDILKLGVVHPLDFEVIKPFLQSHDTVLILEELDDIIEQQIKAFAQDEGISAKILGKTCDEDFIGEYTPDKVHDILFRIWPDRFVTAPVDVIPGIEVPARPAQMCPGCGHRSAFQAIKKALAKTDITVADIGCHTLGFLPPYEMGEVLMCMGASSGMASGLSLGNKDRRVVAFLGDSTFFHAGIPGIINTLFNRHNITLIIMENGTTAMTGHQDHAGGTIPVKEVLKGLGVEHVFSCDTYQQEVLTRQVTEAMNIDGLSVVIASHPCMLKFTRAQSKKPGYTRRHVNIDAAVCTRVHECVAVFGCPSFVLNDDGSVAVNKDLCIGDGSCRQVCPEQAIQY